MAAPVFGAEAQDYVLGYSQPDLSKLAFFRLCPSTSTHAKVDHCPQLCHPAEADPDSYNAVPPKATYVAFRKKSRTKFVNATTLDRKSGAA
jgi:hypothetical protein